MSDLKDALMAFGGKAVSILSEAAARYADGAGYLETLLSLCADDTAHLSSGATWLIKHHLDCGGSLTRQQVEAISEALPHIVDWQAQLHVCQSVGQMDISVAAARRFAEWLTPLVSHKRPFLRAWSLDALYALARRHDDYKTSAVSALESAREDPAASVRARVRRLLQP